ncbi:hypothetical protein KWH94_21685, partial [Citrobacter cronae]|uniref:hypothetical protein n=1 Tax=Citrobacter cronae TaxID=1748967 RepID=UPI0021D1A60A
GHGDFQSPALPTELSGQRGALNRIRACQSIKFQEKRFNRLILRQSVHLCLKFAQIFQIATMPTGHAKRKKGSMAKECFTAS